MQEGDVCDYGDVDMTRGGRNPVGTFTRSVEDSYVRLVIYLGASRKSFVSNAKMLENFEHILVLYLLLCIKIATDATVY